MARAAVATGFCGSVRFAERRTNRVEREALWLPAGADGRCFGASTVTGGKAVCANAGEPYEITHATPTAGATSRNAFRLKPFTEAPQSLLSRTVLKSLQALYSIAFARSPCR
ncbi:MAG TPA: hypothetical protein VGC26_11575, partial [Afipia sp.]